jgi:hypothetical protein
MSNFSTKLNMDDIRREGQIFLAALERLGKELPSLEVQHSKATSPFLKSGPTSELQGFAEDAHPPLNRK